MLKGGEVSTMDGSEDTEDRIVKIDIPSHTG